MFFAGKRSDFHLSILKLLNDPSDCIYKIPDPVDRLIQFEVLIIHESKIDDVSKEISLYNNGPQDITDQVIIEVHQEFVIQYSVASL